MKLCEHLGNEGNASYSHNFAKQCRTLHILILEWCTKHVQKSANLVDPLKNAAKRLFDYFCCKMTTISNRFRERKEGARQVCCTIGAREPCFGIVSPLVEEERNTCQKRNT